MLSKLSGTTIALIILVAVVSSGTVLTLDVLQNSQNNEEFTAKVDFSEGTNYYTLIEIDDGDNNEEESVTHILHEFFFSTEGGGDAISWDFGDGTSGAGAITSHQYELPGNYEVTVTSITKDTVETTNLQVVVNLKGTAEADNMECTCAPTAKDTVIDLFVNPGLQIVEGFVMVEHEGSSESCALRNPLQECHLRVIMQWTEEGSVVGQEVLYDDTFRSNEMVVDFVIEESDFSQASGIQLRLETDQLRDWHKPTAEWSSTIIE
ncbi:MAG: PKD domain-containing protein [Candidatus Poseidoniales archaeon]|nr:MAG: PKD domain-containing protein [Candidatus Poseidoniales archaeon]